MVTVDEQVDALLESVIVEITDLIRQEEAGELIPGNWYYVDIDPEGNVDTGEEINPCYSENEYFNNIPHVLTIWSKTAQANAWTPGSEESSVDEDGDWYDRNQARQDVENILDLDAIRREIAEWIEAGNLIED